MCEILLGPLDFLQSPVSMRPCASVCRTHLSRHVVFHPSRHRHRGRFLHEADLCDDSPQCHGRHFEQVLLVSSKVGRGHVGPQKWTTRGNDRIGTGAFLHAHSAVSILTCSTSGASIYSQESNVQRLKPTPNSAKNSKRSDCGFNHGCSRRSAALG